MNRIGLFIAAAAISVLAHAPGATHFQHRHLSPQEQRGKEIYFGIQNRSDRPIIAVVGDPPTELTGSLAACVGCHGKDGKGSHEAAIPPPEITWETLMKPRAAQPPNGRSRPAYSERLLVRAVSMGIDPAGNDLHVVMPRFQITRRDMNALISYLKVLGEDTRPGSADPCTPATALGTARKHDSSGGSKVQRQTPLAGPHL